MGPQDTVYSNGIFKLDVQVPERYPFEPPNIRFVTPVYHPNIDSGGRICLDILNLPPKGAWRPSLNLATLLASIGLLLAEPNPDDGLMGDITAEYKHNRASFDAKARKWTELYATQDQMAQKVAPDSQLPDQVPKVEKPLNAVSVETLASTGRRDCETGEETTGNSVARYGTSSQLTRPGSSISKRLTLERGTQSLVSCKADSDFCQQSKVEIQRTIIGGNDNSPAILPAEKRYTAVSCKENVIKDNGARKMGEANLSKLVAEVTKEGVSDKDKHADICGAIDLGKGKSATEILQQAKGCKDRHMKICTDNVPIVEGNRRGNSVKGFSNQTMVTDMGRDTLLDVPCSLPTEACKAVSLGTENSTPAMKAVEWTNVRCTEKENQSPKDAVTYATLTSKAAEKVKSPSFAPISGRGKLKLMKEASEQVRPTKSLKLSRTKDEQSSPALSTQSCKHTTDIQKRWDSLIVIPEDVPTVIVSDSDSDDEPSDFRISLTQRSLNRKRNVSSKLR